MDFDDLDPQMRCFALVGQFLHAWSKMEGSLHNAIGLALGIETTKLQILIANLGFRDKINVIRTLVDVNPFFSNEDKAGYKKKFHDLSEYAGRSRNLIAHVPFEPHETGAQFNQVRTKGKFETPSDVWDTKRFQAELTTVNEYCAFIEQVGNRFATQPMPQQAYTAAARRASYSDDVGWQGWQQPRGMSATLMHLLSSHNSDQPNSDKPSEP
jgi:hypothetical protein